MPKFKLIVDVDSVREEAEHLESLIIEADNEDEALTKADKIVKKQMYSGPYYNVEEYDDWDGSNYPKDNPLGEDV